MDPREMWDERYAAAARERGSVWSIGPNSWVEGELADARPGTAVDLGCGEGRNALWLASRGWRVTGVDFSAPGIATARARAARAGLTADFVVADAATWQPPEPVDLVLIAYLHLEAEMIDRILRAAASWVRPGGLLLVVGHDRENLEHGVGGPRIPSILYTPELLRAGVAGLEVERCERMRRATDAGEAIDTVLVARRSR